MQETTPAISPKTQRTVLMGLACYLLNLLILPGLPVLMIGWLYFLRPAEPVAKAYLKQFWYWSITGGVLLLMTCVLVWWQIRAGNATAWVWLVVYLLCVHTTLVLMGMLSLARILAGRVCLPVWPVSERH
ncbi:hypothetical protein [Leeia oryzae]|uniref:hypothetical protein n=1 Tax=Leeia oryzae TaxID=356662 RepID=UPI00037DAC23|nr:hypothetical protein [Leeia oryzae]